MTEDVVRHEGDVGREERWAALNVRGAVVWLTGLSGSGKSTIAFAVERQLVAGRQPAVVLDGDNLRHGLNADLGFSEDDRRENIRRVAQVAVLFAESGVVALVPLISPYRSSRDAARSDAEAVSVPFIEVFVDTPIEECERRDPKGLYAKARAGELKHFTGIDDPYEAPTHPDLHLAPGPDPESAAATIAALLDD